MKSTHYLTQPRTELLPDQETFGIGKDAALFLASALSWPFLSYSIPMADAPTNSKPAAAASASAMPTRRPTQTFRFRLYSVLNIGKPGTPKLTAEQIAWVRRVEASPYYSKSLGALWFSPFPSVKHPLIIVVGDLSSAVMNGDERGAVSDYWVIGDPCNDAFDISRGEFATMDELCKPEVYP
jgi:hypothetical protein